MRRDHKSVQEGIPTVGGEGQADIRETRMKELTAHLLSSKSEFEIKSGKK